MITLTQLRDANILRDKEWGSDKLDLVFFLNELAGEAGELCNVLKKRYREQLGITGSRASLDDIRKECCDVAIVADLCLMQLGFGPIKWVKPSDMKFMSPSAMGRLLMIYVGYACEDPDEATLSDVYDCVNGIALSFDWDLLAEIPKKFNETSTKYGLSVFLPE